MNERLRIEDWFERHNLTLDLAGLSQAGIDENSIFLGGQNKQVVKPHDNFNYAEVGNIVFKWGDQKALDVITILLEHDDSPDARYIGFNANTIVGDRLWTLAMQPRNWDPDLAYSSDLNYVVIPYEIRQAASDIERIQTGSSPKPQMISKLERRWFLWEMSKSLDQSALDPIEQPVAIKTDKTPDYINFINELVRVSNLDKLSNERLFRFATHFGHWALETFGVSERSSENFRLIPYSEGFNGEELPGSIKHLVAQVHKNTIVYQTENVISMNTEHICIEEDPEIPDWEHIKDLPTFTQQIDYIKAHPKVLAGLKESEVEVLPQVRLCFEPIYYGRSKWGLEFLVSNNGVQLAVFGESGTTRNAMSCAIELLSNPGRLARTFIDLTVLAVKHRSLDYVAQDTMPAAVDITLINRLSGLEPIPLIVNKDFQFSPTSHVKNLLISSVRKPAE